METATVVSVCGFVPASLAAERRCAAGVVVFKADEQAGELCIFCLQRTLSSLPPSILAECEQRVLEQAEQLHAVASWKPTVSTSKLWPCTLQGPEHCWRGLGHRGGAWDTGVL